MKEGGGKGERGVSYKEGGRGEGGERIENLLISAAVIHWGGMAK